MIGDKTKYIEHIQDKEQHIVMRKILDKIESVLRHHDVEYTDFLDPYQRKLSHSILNRLDVSYYEEGGLEDSERKSIIIFPEYMSKENIENPIKAIKIEGNFKFTNLRHKDYLGAILGLGIKREKVGDINIYEDFAIILLHKELLDFVIYNLKNIGRENVTVRQISLGEIEKTKEEFEDIQTTISSLRLDALISGVCNLSRSKSANQIAQGKVKVNWQPILNASYEIGEDDVISIRGFGRIKIISELGKSKKGKDKVTVRIYK
ncbi:putative RNA-binding S4 domain-containing protein [Gottschalkia acidurici 9a]|uniref:RNA-binding S4 domain-containing protein n=1 Tax=Gottschalkia acidurici (strain ATCC 7906 / DSM 604 / BCRC 14475 / CIP 104303 / KCTC 5404 / NCIMB 10678 / 9a) TaxID=1128398 RepID=K0B0V3_GOTA9|nr:YlmH/Sll1252 family protein [Gottschalkia acidurici]AFS78707.1 putative RNA-binding S4 domain-containing protein [Gottschalkia acidurici 9a]